MRLLILLLIPNLSFASKISQSTSILEKPDAIKIHGKIEIEAKTTQDKSKKSDGHNLTTDVKFFIGGTSGLLVGGEHETTQRKDKEHTQAWQEASVGGYYNFEVTDKKVKTYLLYNHIPDEQIRQSSGRNASLEADVRTNLYSNNLKTKLRYTFTENFRNDFEESTTETRQSKLEVSPAYMMGSWGLGLQNKLTNKYLLEGNSGSLESAPFIKHEGKYFEPKLRVIYRPVVISNHTYIRAKDWEYSPFYSFELEANF